MKTTLNMRSVAALLGLALILAQNAANACPGCKQVDGAPLSGASIAFGWDIGFMLLMIGSLLGGLSFMIYKSCRVLAERDRLAEESAEFAAGEPA